MKGATQLDRAVNWLEEYALFIVAGIGAFIHLIDVLETLHFVMLVVIGLILYILYIIYDRRQYLEKTDILLK